MFSVCLIERKKRKRRKKGTKKAEKKDGGRRKRRRRGAGVGIDISLIFVGVFWGVSVGVGHVVSVM